MELGVSRLVTRDRWIKLPPGHSQHTIASIMQKQATRRYKTRHRNEPDTLQHWASHSVYLRAYHPGHACKNLSTAVIEAIQFKTSLMKAAQGTGEVVDAGEGSGGTNSEGAAGKRGHR